MKVSVLLLFALVTFVVLSSVESWRIRRAIRRIRLRRICKSICKTTCKRKCPACRPICSTACSKVCGKKRALPELEVRDACNFAKYDRDGDGYISNEEFKSNGDEYTESVFEGIDTDDDDRIGEREFEDTCDKKRDVEDELNY